MEVLHEHGYEYECDCGFNLFHTLEKVEDASDSAFVLFWYIRMMMTSKLDWQ